METCAITFMPGEAILGIEIIVLTHKPVAGHFRDDRRGGDRQALAVAAHYAPDGASGRYLHPAVHYDIIWRNLELGDGHLHSFYGRAVDIDPVDRLFVDYADAEYGLRDYLRVSPLPLGG